MSHALTVKEEFKTTVYDRMCKAIKSCYAFDECKDIVDRSVAFSAYYKQIKDDESERMFIELRLRAWRRMAELLKPVDLKGCTKQPEKAARVRSFFNNNETIAEMSDFRILELLKLSELTDADFEYALKQRTSNTLTNIIASSPKEIARRERERLAWEKELRKREHERLAWEEENKQVLEKEKLKQQKKVELERIETKNLSELALASKDAMKEVGITLELKEREKMKTIVFLIKDSVYEVLRQAAFDNRITMQEVLRRGLKIWLTAQGYKFPDE